MFLHKSLSTLIFSLWNFNNTTADSFISKFLGTRHWENETHSLYVMEFTENNAFLTTGVYFPPQGPNDNLKKNYGTDYAIYVYNAFVLGCLLWENSRTVVFGL